MLLMTKTLAAMLAVLSGLLGAWPPAAVAQVKVVIPRSAAPVGVAAIGTHTHGASLAHARPISLPPAATTLLRRSVASPSVQAAPLPAAGDSETPIVKRAALARFSTPVEIADAPALLDGLYIGKPQARALDVATLGGVSAPPSLGKRPFLGTVQGKIAVGAAALLPASAFAATASPDTVGQWILGAFAAAVAAPVVVKAAARVRELLWRAGAMKRMPTPLAKSLLKDWQRGADNPGAPRSHNDVFQPTYAKVFADLQSRLGLKLAFQATTRARVEVDDQDEVRIEESIAADVKVYKVAGRKKGYVLDVEYTHPDYSGVGSGTRAEGWGQGVSLYFLRDLTELQGLIKGTRTENEEDAGERLRELYGSLDRYSVGSLHMFKRGSYDHGYPGWSAEAQGLAALSDLDFTGDISRRRAYSIGVEQALLGFLERMDRSVELLEGQK
jgi:hypothetical protein